MRLPAYKSKKTVVYSPSNFIREVSIMKINNILCPTDFSPLASKAVERAGQLAKRHNAVLHIVHIYEPVFAEPTGEGALPADLSGVQEELEATKPSAEGVRCQHAFIYGLPAGTICGYARTNEIDLIVMGAHGDLGVNRPTLGSVAETVVRSADCAVMTVRDGETEIDRPPMSGNEVATIGTESPGV